jgi:hypothetical protein
MHVEYKQIVDNRLLVQIDDVRAAVTLRIYSVPIFGLADAHRICKHGLEDRLQLAR